jgi:uncharacterized protein YndB with AHSA1/START domain
MSKGFLAKVLLHIDAPEAAVWKALTDPAIIKKYMFDADVASDWKTGSVISIKGIWKGAPYEDKGIVLESVPGRKLVYTHFSPLSGLPDKPENYHTITITLDAKGTETDLTLTQDNNATEEEKKHSEGNWSMMMNGMKKVAEAIPPGC